MIFLFLLLSPVLYKVVYHIYKIFMDSGISGQFRMKGKTDLMLILYGDDMIIHGAEYLDGLFDRSDIRGTDKYHRKGGNLSEICCGAKAAKLSAIGITFDSNRQGGQVGRVARWAGSPLSISSESRIRPAQVARTGSPWRIIF